MQDTARDLKIEVPDQTTPEWNTFATKLLETVIKKASDLSIERYQMLRDILQGGMDDQVSRETRNSYEYQTLMNFVLNTWQEEKKNKKREKLRSLYQWREHQDQKTQEYHSLGTAGTELMKLIAEEKRKLERERRELERERRRKVIKDARKMLIERGNMHKEENR